MLYRGYGAHGTGVRCNGCSGYSGGVRRVQWKGAVGTVSWYGGYGGYGGKVRQWVQWKVWVMWMGTVHIEEGLRGYREMELVQSRGKERRYTLHHPLETQRIFLIIQVSVE